MPENKNSNRILFLVVGLGLAVAAVLYFTVVQKAVPTNLETEVAQQETATQSATPTNIDVTAALSERILGNPSAPIKISEHSSLTCPHCAHFHRDTLPRLKAEYIDTGKAYLVFSDFPLNAPAMQASSLARCMTPDQYFPFVETLFSTQDSWANEPDYLARLKEAGMKAGLDEATASACLQSKEIQEGLAAAMKAAQGQWTINSTPTLVINNKKVIPGSSPYEEIVKAMNEASGATPSEPTASPEAATPASEGQSAPAPEAELPQDMPPQPETAAPEAQSQETPATP